MNRTLLAAVFAGGITFGAVGDHAPSVPSTYVQTHPRLGAPSNTFLNTLWNGGTLPSRYSTAASGWDSTNPGSLVNFRYLLLSYMADKLHSGPNNAAWLTKLRNLAHLGGVWAPQIYFVTDGAGAGGACTVSCTVTTAGGNWTTGCGGSCNAYYAVWRGRIYTVSNTTATALTLVGGATGTVAPSGSGLTISIANGIGSSLNDSLAVAMLYDFIYADLDAYTKAELLGTLENYSAIFELTYGQPSPFNDQFYIRANYQWLAVALAAYPDDPTVTLPHLRCAMDVWLNTVLPVWKKITAGGCSLAENDAGTANSAAGVPGCGAEWHESWDSYFNPPAANGVSVFYLTNMLVWANATGQMPSWFTNNGWAKNIAYWPMYVTRPDWMTANWGDVGRAYLLPEYDVAGFGAGPGFMEGLAAIYNDPTIRGYARILDNNTSPDGFEPTAWPFYTPDSGGNSTNTRASLGKTRDFPGHGLYVRTGWGESDTMVMIRHADSYWSHQRADFGSFDIFSRGHLALGATGDYRTGSGSAHFVKYAQQGIAHNIVTVTDSGDAYAGETFQIYHNDGSTTQDTMPNDGGYKRDFDPFNQHFSAVIPSPSDIAQWLRGREYYHNGSVVGYAVGAGNKYIYIALDTTDAYNNTWSRNAYSTAYAATTANTMNRSFRVRSSTRQFVIIPRGTAAYVLVFDNVTSTNTAFTKKWLLHTVNQPVIASNTYTVTRADLVTNKPYPGFWSAFAAQLPGRFCGGACTTSSTQYQYDGKLYGWVTMAGNSPGGATPTLVGGSGHEFDIGGTNYSECMQGQCGSREGLGAVTDFINPEPLTVPHEPGSWRMEETPTTGHLQDWFINVMLATTTGDTNTVSTAPSTSVSGTEFVTTWKDASNTCTYTVTLPQNGVGGSITATGAGCASTI